MQNIWTVKRLSQSDIYKCKCLFWAHFSIPQMVLVIAFAQKSILILLVSSAQPRSNPKTSFTEVWCLIHPSPPPPSTTPRPPGLVSGLCFGLLCLTIRHAVLICNLIRWWNLGKLKPIPFQKYKVHSLRLCIIHAFLHYNYGSNSLP